MGQGYEYEQTRDAWLTNPDEAVAYVEQTQCDCLAVAVGTSHRRLQRNAQTGFCPSGKAQQLGFRTFGAARRQRHGR